MNVTHRNTEILTGTLMCRIGSVSPTERFTVPTVTNSRMDSGGSMDVCMLGQVPYDSMTIYCSTRPFAPPILLSYWVIPNPKSRDPRPLHLPTVCP